jgi:hypothetical protein
MQSSLNICMLGLYFPGMIPVIAQFSDRARPLQFPQKYNIVSNSWPFLKLLILNRKHGEAPKINSKILLLPAHAVLHARRPTEQAGNARDSPTLKNVKVRQASSEGEPNGLLLLQAAGRQSSRERRKQHAAAC